MSHLYIAICDDEKIHLDRIYNYLIEYFSNKNTIYTIDIFKSTDQVIESNKNYDFAFLDIEAGRESGLCAARRLVEKKSNAFIFFITHYQFHLDEAMNINPFRYFTKPFNKSRFFSSLDIALKKWEQSKEKIIITESKSKEKFSIEADNIMFIENRDRKTKIITKKRVFFATEGYKVLRQNLLSYNDFCESHQSFIVNLNYLTKYNKEIIRLEYGSSHYEVLVSRRKYKEFDKKFMKFAGDLK